MNDLAPLRFALLANAALSVVLGCVMTVAPSLVSGWLGVEIDGWLRLLGIGLVSHGLALMWVDHIGLPHRWILMNLMIIAPYPLVMLSVVAGGVVETTQGRVLVLADGAAVGLLAVAQWSGLRSAPRAV